MHRPPNKGESLADYIKALFHDPDVKQMYRFPEAREAFLTAEYHADRDEAPAPAPVTLETFKEAPKPEPTVEDTEADDDEE